MEVMNPPQKNAQTCTRFYTQFEELYRHLESLGQKLCNSTEFSFAILPQMDMALVSKHTTLQIRSKMFRPQR